MLTIGMTLTAIVRLKKEFMLYNENFY